MVFSLSIIYLEDMRPVVLTILDGWGYSANRIGNAIFNAEKPNMDFILANYPTTLLQASGKAVGLTWGETGNSEVGHLTIGAGRIIFQYLSRINKAVETGDFFKNPALLKLAEHVHKEKSKLHIAGLLTSGSVHAYFDHILALLEFSKVNKITLKIHLFTDGKDSGLKEGKALLDKLNAYMPDYPDAALATVIGRNFSMDRNNNWDLTEKAYRLLVRGEGEKINTPEKKLEEYYEQGIHDNNIPPLLVDPSGTIKDGDALFFFNFREDSVRQIIRCFIEEGFNLFPTQKFTDLIVAGMTQYLENPKLMVAFDPPEVKNGLAEVLNANNKNQLHVAETEKYAHVTFFFNCLINAPFKGETDIFIKSTKKPEDESAMMANEIVAKVIEELQHDFYDFILVNFANADMLAHAGSLENAIKGIETVDACVGRLKEAVFAKNGVLIVTADHGNAESMTYKGGEEETKHDLNPVFFHVVVKEYERQKSEEEIKKSISETRGILADVAPTILEIFGIPKPEEMTGESLFKSLL